MDYPEKTTLIAHLHPVANRNLTQRRKDAKEIRGKLIVRIRITLSVHQYGEDGRSA